ncbi:MAG: phosphatidylserine decarboxylase family protein [Bacteroidia bacterium]|nr:phosphatidylserine decarboxylase family protein [Bacteroidia bacterium]
MKIHRQGILPITLFSALLLLIAAAISAVFSLEDWIILFIWVSTGTLILLFSMFFRMPNRKMYRDPNAIVSAADGKIVAIENVYEKEFLKENCIVISVFMSIYNIHVNIIPMQGKIEYTKHHPGKNYPAINPKSSELNEMYSTVIHAEKCSILIRQIAGIAARRIYVSVKKGNEVMQGDELGIIKLGSRVDLFLPETAKINVSLGDKVKAGQSVLAWLR